MECESCDRLVDPGDLDCMKVNVHVSGYSLLLIFCRVCADDEACVVPEANEIVRRAKELVL